MIFRGIFRSSISEDLCCLFRRFPITKVFCVAVDNAHVSGRTCICHHIIVVEQSIWQTYNCYLPHPTKNCPTDILLLHRHYFLHRSNSYPYLTFPKDTHAVFVLLIARERYNILYYKTSKRWILKNLTQFGHDSPNQFFQPTPSPT